MTDRAERIAELVETALEQEPKSWPGFLDQACGDDAALRAEVQSLLGFNEQARDFIEVPAVHQNADAFTAEAGELKPGQDLDVYRIVSLIGEGGMGEVYLAQDTALGRQVAIKLVKRAVANAHMIRRFRDEERILASLNHPLIARLYGGGLSPDGAPYFVMEYVEGERLDEFCNHRRLPIPERLELFRKVCSAVTYAHQHLVVHRDLKPANIRVSADGEPKLLDFGIAKLLDPQTSGAADQTLTVLGVMTPEYASPEQIRGEPITTASDVYSLGVILYELLTGRRPYRVTGRRPEEIARAVAEQTPERPSTALGRNENAATFAVHNPKALRGDLDNIVLMATRKEPARRYSSVGQFSEDIRRHLAGLPVIARKDTLGYRSGKFVRRHRVGVAAAAVVLITLVGGIVATAWEARRAERQRARAERRFHQVRQLANSLMFEIHDAVQDLQGSTPTRRLIVSRALEYLDSLAEESSDDRSLQTELATAYEKIGDIQGNPYSANLGDTDGALASYRKAIAIREDLDRKQSTIETQMAIGRGYRALGDIFELRGNIAETTRYYRDSLALFDRLAKAAPADPAVQDELARAYETLGDGLAREENARSQRLRCYQTALGIREQLLAATPDAKKIRRAVATSLMKVGATSDPKAPEAVQSVKRAIQILEALAAADPNNARARREVGHVYHELGAVQIGAGDFAGALESRRKTLAIQEQIAIHDPTNTQARFDLAVAHADVSEALAGLGQTGQALAEAEASLPLLEQLCASDPANAVYLRNLALCFQLFGETHARIAASDTNDRQQRIGHWADARSWFEKAAGVFNNLKTGGKLMPSDAGEAERLTARAAECAAAIQRL